jgi:hypothetical protein
MKNNDTAMSANSGTIAADRVIKKFIVSRQNREHPNFKAKA